MDLYTAEDTLVPQGERAVVPTGVALELPEGYVALVWDKSGISLKTGITTIGGVMDAGYRGEYLISVVNLGTADYTFKRGDKVAQILVQAVVRPTCVEVTELSDTTRGANGFGSTGT